ncbi:MAG: ArsR family transcriptional regulator [Candidatus Hodarchaeota archaeon]
MKGTFDNLSRVFSNSTRLQIMYLLYEDSQTITELTAKISNVSASVVSRHLSLLDEYNIIDKKAVTSRNYELSPFGESILRIMNPLTFFIKKSAYFKSHSLKSLPSNFLRNIDILDNAIFVEGTGSVMNELTTNTSNIKHSIFYIASSHFLIPHYNYKEIRVIYPIWLYEQLGVPKLREDIEKNTNLSPDDVHIRLLPEIDVGVAIYDDYEKGIIVFPRNDDKGLDYNGLFVIEDKTGMEYLKDIWTYYWNLSEPASLEL